MCSKAIPVQYSSFYRELSARVLSISFTLFRRPYLTGRATIGRLELPPGEGQFVEHPLQYEKPPRREYCTGTVQYSTVWYRVQYSIDAWRETDILPFPFP